MIVEYILFLLVVLVLIFKVVFYAPSKAFSQAMPRFAGRVEKHLASGEPFTQNVPSGFSWKTVTNP